VEGGVFDFDGEVKEVAKDGGLVGDIDAEEVEVVAADE